MNGFTDKDEQTFLNACAAATRFFGATVLSLPEDLSAYFFVAHRMFLRFDLSDIVRRTPSANPAAAEMKIKTAWGIATVANSRCVSTGSVFWTTRIATKIAKIEAVMSFRSRIGL
jgi:hypothetical protein